MVLIEMIKSFSKITWQKNFVKINLDKDNLI